MNAAYLTGRFDLVTDHIQVAGSRITICRPRKADELIDEAEFNRDERLPYWADLWPASVVLAKRVAEESGAGRTLLELGCGVGLVSIAAVKAGFRVTASDYYEPALEFTRLNAAINGAELETRLLDWRDWPADLPQFDVVVASDVLYERRYPMIVAAGFRHALAPGGLGLLTDPQRSVAAPFPVECARAELRVSRTTAIQGSGKASAIDLYEIRALPEHQPEA